MRIAFLLDQFPTLSETFILNQIVGLIVDGHEVDIYADRPGDTAKVHHEVEKYRLLDRTYYTRIPSSRFERLVKGIELLLANFHKNPSVLINSLNIFKYSFSEYGEQARKLRLFYSVIPFLGKLPYDIIHCHYGRNGIRGLMLRELGILSGKLLTTFHGFDISSYLQKYGDRIYDRLFEKGDLFLPISEHWKGRLIELGCNEKKIIVHRMGIDCTKFLFNSPELLPQDKIKIVTIARLVGKKGVEYGIRAIATLAKLKPNIQYDIVGDGPLKENLQQLIYELDASHVVKLLGWKQQQELLEILKQAHIVLAPSITSKDGDQEGIPVILMEAMATGKLVVSTRYSGIPELIEDGTSGLLTEERDVKSLVEKLNYLIENPDIWANMALAGRVYVEKHYDIHKLNERLVEIYKQQLL
ncbi:MAG TPA: glycosyltransferase [Leptolyngbyaceae cyanobacterium]